MCERARVCAAFVCLTTVVFVKVEPQPPALIAVQPQPPADIEVQPPGSIEVQEVKVKVCFLACPCFSLGFEGAFPCVDAIADLYQTTVTVLCS